MNVAAGLGDIWEVLATENQAATKPKQRRSPVGWIRPEEYGGFRMPDNWRTRDLAKEGKLYVIRSGAFLKIGISSEFPKRLAAYRLHNPHELHVACCRSVPWSLARQIEKKLLKHFAEHSAGGEWFHDTADVHLIGEVAHGLIAKARRALKNWHIDERHGRRRRA